MADSRFLFESADSENSRCYPKNSRRFAKVFARGSRYLCKEQRNGAHSHQVFDDESHARQWAQLVTEKNGYKVTYGAEWLSRCTKSPLEGG